MRANNNYTDMKNGHNTISCIGKLLLIIAFIIGLLSLAQLCNGQKWQNECKGLYPNSIGVTCNAKNHSLGVQYGYLFQKPVFNTPIGLYASYSHTIHPNKWINNYDWEEKYAIGLKFALPHAFEDGLTHTFITIGPVWNRHPREWQNENLLPGQSYADIEPTTAIGLDLGVSMQMKRCLVQIVKIDVINWFQYAEFGVSYCFSFHKSQ